MYLIFVGEPKGDGFSGMLEFVCEINVKIYSKKSVGICVLGSCVSSFHAVAYCAKHDTHIRFL